jgi:hypothetical protein
VAAPGYVFTIARAAEMLDEDEEWLEELAEQLEPQAAAVLAELPWRRVTWRHGTKGPLAARFAVTRIRVGDGEIWANNRDLPGDEVWLVGEWRSSGERKHYLSNLPPRTSLRALAAAHQGALGVRAWTPATQTGSKALPSTAWATSRAGPGRACTGTR